MADFGVSARIDEKMWIINAVAQVATVVIILVLTLLFAPGVFAQSSSRYILSPGPSSLTWSPLTTGLPTDRDPDHIPANLFVSSESGSTPAGKTKVSFQDLRSYIDPVLQRESTCRFISFATTSDFLTCYQPGSTVVERSVTGMKGYLSGFSGIRDIVRVRFIVTTTPRLVLDTAPGGGAKQYLRYEWAMYGSDSLNPTSWSLMNGGPTMDSLNCVQVAWFNGYCPYLGVVSTTTDPPPVEEDLCLTSTKNGWPTNGEPMEYQMPWQAVYIPTSDTEGYWTAVGNVARYPGASEYAQQCKIYRGSPSGVGVCYGLADPLRSEADPDKRFVWCSVYSNGDRWLPGDEPDVVLVPAETPMKKMSQIPTQVGAAPNGSPINKDTPSSLAEVEPEIPWTEICAPQDGVKSCVQVGDKVVIVRVENGCMTKEYWHDGNVSGNGVCIGTYDRDWPDAGEGYSPDKAWKWEPGPPASGTDISDGKMSCIGDTGKPVTCASKEQKGDIVQYPSSAGGGNSTTNPGNPGGVEPPIGLPGVPGGQGGEGGGFYESQFEDGIGGVWGDFTEEFVSTEFIGSLNAFKLDGVKTDGPFCITMPLGLDPDNPQDVDMCVEDALMDLLALVVAAGVGVTCLKIVFGI